MRAWTSATFAAHIAASGASRLSRSKGSVFDGPEVEPPVAEVDGQSVEAVLGLGREGRRHPVDHRGRIGHGAVELARRGVPVEGLAELGQRQAGLAELLEHEQRRDRTGVGAVVVAEVVVRGVLAAEGGARLGHHGLDVAVADLGPHRGAAVLAHDLGDGLGADAVVQDRGIRDACRAHRPRRWRWWWSRTPADPARPRGTRDRRRRRRPARHPRPPPARAPAGRAGSRPGADRPDGWGRSRRARRTAPRARPGGRRTRPGPPGRPCRSRCRPPP